MKSQSLSARVMKAMSVFGGVQAVSILCSIVRTKLVAIWIGAVGVGLFGLYNSAVDLITMFMGMGLSTSGAREVAAAESDKAKRRAMAILNSWTLWLAVVAAALTIIASPLLSLISFGDLGHAGAFCLLSVTIFVSIFMSRYAATLQGLKRYSRYAHAMLWGSVGGTLCAVPLFFFFRVESIIPVLICTAVCLLLGFWVNREKVLTPMPGLGRQEVVTGGKGLVKLGFFIAMSSAIGYLSSYIFISYLTSRHGSDAAGLFQAGFTLINRYVGLLFAAIAMEYYPRLSGVADRRWVSQVYVSHELKVALCVLAPVVALFIAFSPLIIRLLYSGEFAIIQPMVVAGVAGTVFRAVSWCMAFVILARGDGKIFLITETVSGIVYLAVNILFYETWGIESMGWAYSLWYLIYAAAVAAVYFFRYRMTLGRGMTWLILYTLLASAAAYAACYLFGYIAAGVVALITAAISLRLLMGRN